jgi:hypothetical protein
MHPITTDDPAFDALSRAGENLLIDKTTRRRYPAAPSGSLLLTSAPFGWRGIIVEQHRLSPAEMPKRYRTLPLSTSVDSSKPATDRHVKTGHRGRGGRDQLEFYFVASSVRKSVWTLVRQLRGPHLRTCA